MAEFNEPCVQPAATELRPDHDHESELQLTDAQKRHAELLALEEALAASLASL